MTTAITYITKELIQPMWSRIYEEREWSRRSEKRRQIEGPDSAFVSVFASEAKLHLCPSGDSVVNPP